MSLSATTWGIILEYDEPKRGDIARLTYTSSTNLVTFSYRPPHTSSLVVSRDLGLPRFFAIRSMIHRKPISKTVWRHKEPTSGS